MPIFLGIGVVGLVVVAALALIATRPADFRIQRSAQIDAPRDVLFSIINNLHQWGQWSPYDKRDPNMKKTFEGPSSGPGASYAWNGNNAVGEGRLTIVESKPAELITMKLEFSRPFKCTNEVNFKLEPSQGGTRVSWIMDGKNNFMTKAMSLFMNMDKMVGKDFEEGLANLSGVAQGRKRQSSRRQSGSRRGTLSLRAQNQSGLAPLEWGALVAARAPFRMRGSYGIDVPYLLPISGGALGDQSENAAAATRRNAVAEGVAGRVELHTADMTALPFEDRSFDVVLSSLAVALRLEGRSEV